MAAQGKLEKEGRWEVMVMQALHRIIEARGGSSNIKEVDVKRRRAWKGQD